MRVDLEPETAAAAVAEDMGFGTGGDSTWRLAMLAP